MGGGFRVAIFTHDTFGLGHIRRSLHFARSLADDPEAAVLLVTGSPSLHVLDDIPQNVDFVKIPTIARTGKRSLRPPHLPIPLDDVTAMRSRLIKEAILSFSPDVFLVDNFPLGSRGELLPVLQELATTRVKTVLGLRDIVDAPETVCSDWKQHNIYAVLEDLYDRILIYGNKSILDVVTAYKLPQGTASKVTYCGYVSAKPKKELLSADMDQLGMSPPFLLATGGGGGDGFPLLKTFAQAMDIMPLDRGVIVTGPLMNRSLRKEIERAGKNNNVVVRSFVPDLAAYFGIADVVVSMCGYNTAIEIVSRGAKAIVVPRTWKYGEHEIGEAAGIEMEQKLRAEALSKLGFVSMLDPQDLTPQNLVRRIDEVRSGKAKTHRQELDFNGIQAVTDQVLSLVQETKDGGCP